MKDEWKEGYPPETGWYHCMVDGEEKKLRHFECCVSAARHEWIDKDGQYEYGNVLWRGERIKPKS